MLDGIDHLERPVGGPIALGIRRCHEYREKLRPHAASLHAGEISVSIGVRRADIQPGHRPARNVVVGIDEYSPRMNAADLRIRDGSFHTPRRLARKKRRTRHGNENHPAHHITLLNHDQTVCGVVKAGEQET
jgi:hypothetical protein